MTRCSCIIQPVRTRLSFFLSRFFLPLSVVCPISASRYNVATYPLAVERLPEPTPWNNLDANSRPGAHPRLNLISVNRIPANRGVESQTTPDFVCRRTSVVPFENPVSPSRNLWLIPDVRSFAFRDIIQNDRRTVKIAFNCFIGNFFY